MIRSQRFESRPFNAAILAVLLALVSFLPASGQAQDDEKKEPTAEDILNNIVVVANDKQLKPLPKIAIQPSLASNIEDVTIRSVMRRDLDLSGEFRVLPDSDAPEQLYLSDTPVDVKAWQKKGAEAVVKVHGKKIAKGKVELYGEAYFVDTGNKPVFKVRRESTPAEVRAQSHRIADAVIGALTGTPGAFSSQLTFIYGSGKSRRVYVIDADGHEPHAVSTDDQLALSPVFGSDHQLFYAASVRHDAFKVYSPGDPTPLDIDPPGSVYGIAFSRKHDQVALSIAVGMTINVFTGPDFGDLKRASKIGMALHPAFSPTGKLAFSGASKRGQQRIYVDGKAISPAGLSASAPVFCRHPDGVRAVYAVGVGKNTDLVASDELGGNLKRLTRNRSRNNYPACSPDGRLIAFFSTRTSGKGPGLYIMRIDGRRPKRIATLVGDSLRWARLPESHRRAKAKVTKKRAKGVKAVRVDKEEKLRKVR